MFDSKFITRRPQGPAHGSKADPKQSPLGPNQRISQGAQVSEGGRSPGHMHPGSDATPKQLSQNTIEENMRRVFSQTTKRTTIRARAIMFANLVTRRQTPTRGLPEENLNLRRDTSPPNPIEFGGGGSGNKLSIKGFHRETSIRGVVPNNRVFLLRERREESNKTLPVFQLCRSERAMQTQVPIIRRELKD